MKIVAKQEHIEYESMFQQKKVERTARRKALKKNKIHTVQCWYPETPMLKKITLFVIQPHCIASNEVNTWSLSRSF